MLVLPFFSFACHPHSVREDVQPLFACVSPVHLDGLLNQTNKQTMASVIANDGLDQIQNPSNRRRQTRQACDKCRERKVRCDVGFVSDAPLPSAHLTRSEDASQSLGGPARPCRRCSLLHLPCTFLLPVKARGPVK